MRAVTPSLLLALALAAPLHATEPESAEVTPVPEVAPLAAPETPAPPAMKLDEIQVKERSADDADVAQMPARGSFWWLVGVIVVAGVILALLL